MYFSVTNKDHRIGYQYNHTPLVERILPAHTHTSGNNRPKGVLSMLVDYERQLAADQMAYQTQSAREAMQFNADQAAMNRDFQLQSAREAMAFEADQAERNRQYQTYMSNTAVQRGMADLKAAGINPILAYQYSAAVPAGSTAAGYQAAGSSASGVAQSGAKADSILGFVSEIIKTAVNGVTSALNAVGEIIPF